ncbi:MAG: HAMP domain-containing histidine kinase [Clostridia bacterium]|nr:HAMP domain-containing histidine kinase [Clostridia bacterium]
MKLGTKVSLVIVAVFVINAAVTVLFTMPDANPAVSVAVIVSTHIITLSLAILAIHLIVTRPLKELKKSMKNYRAGNKPGRVQRSDEIGELYNSFSSLSSQIDAERSAQNRIIASISHDIKTPLTSVMGYAEFLKNPNLSEARREKYINVIYDKAKDIQDTVLGFDDYLSHNLDLNLKREFMTVADLIDGAVEDMKTDVVGSQVTVSGDCGACGATQVYVDRQRLHRVFMNAVSNSVKHSGKDDLHIVISAERSDDDVLIKIRDDGRGVKPDQLEKIFEPLYTTDKSRSVAGLGLSICRQIVGSHGGTIYAESEYGKYFAVCFTLPAVTAGKTQA